MKEKAKKKTINCNNDEVIMCKIVKFIGRKVNENTSCFSTREHF